MTVNTVGPLAVQARIAAIESRFAAMAGPTASSWVSQSSSSVSQGSSSVSQRSSSVGQSASFAEALAKAAPAAGNRPKGDGSPSGAQVVADARRYLGIPYVWGGTDPAKGFDCSGLVQHVYKDLGVDLPRLVHEQARVGTRVPSLAEARPGDLVIFGSSYGHVGIYIGNGKMIAAPKRGDVVKVQDVYETPSMIRRIVSGSTGSSSLAVSSSPASSGSGGAGSSPAMAAAPATYRTLFRQAGKRYGVSPDLLAAVAQTESNFHPRAVSPAGARGLMQLMPATARGLGVDPMNPAQAVDGAARLLSQHLRSFGSTSLALAAYNAGPGAVTRYHGVPPYAETRRYVAKVLAAAGRSA
jgi:peptidoglycan DL-endopeptidase CwlO